MSDKTPTMEQLKALKDRALTPEQLEARERHARFEAIVQAGVKQPKSGTFGKAPKS